VRGGASPTKYSQIAHGEGRSAKIGEGRILQYREKVLSHFSWYWFFSFLCQLFRATPASRDWKMILWKCLVCDRIEHGSGRTGQRAYIYRNLGEYLQLKPRCVHNVGRKWLIQTLKRGLATRGWEQTNFVELWSVSCPRFAEMAIEIWVICQLTGKLFETSSVRWNLQVRIFMQILGDTSISEHLMEWKRKETCIE